MFHHREDAVRKAVEKIRSDPAMATTLIDALDSTAAPKSAPVIERVATNDAEEKIRNLAQSVL